MSHQRDKEKWLKIQEHKKKTCQNCSQLFWNNSGNPCCAYDDGTSPNTYYVIHDPSYIKCVHPICFDKYNGKNIKKTNKHSYNKIFIK